MAFLFAICVPLTLVVDLVLPILIQIHGLGYSIGSIEARGKYLGRLARGEIWWLKIRPTSGHWMLG